eukprot:354799-Chlamydomonas_euryale.AAC.4
MAAPRLVKGGPNAGKSLPQGWQRAAPRLVKGGPNAGKGRPQGWQRAAESRVCHRACGDPIYVVRGVDAHSLSRETRSMQCAAWMPIA